MQINPHTVGHETEDASVGGILFVGVGLAVAILVSGLIVFGIFEYLKDRPDQVGPSNPMAESGNQPFPPAPRIDEYPASEMKQLREQEDRLLTTYGWVDKNSGLVRIPIDRAKRLQLERGFPLRKEAGK